MRVREHLSHHEAVEDLPLITESAVVTDVSAMDRNRTEEVLAEIRSTLDANGTEAWHEARPATAEDCEEWLEGSLDRADHLDGDRPLDRYLPDDDPAGGKLAALQGRYLQPYPSLLRVTVESDDPVEFLPGQYLAVRYDDTTRAYSVASAPSREAIEFCVRRVPGGEMTTDVAVDLEAGDEVTLRGPYGDLLMEAPSPRDVVFLATGTGVAPFRSMIDDCFESGRDRYEGHPRNVWLFLGAGWEDALPYHRVLQSYADERTNFHYVPTLSRESYLTDWDGETAYVQYALAKHLDDDAVDADALPAEFARYVDDRPRSGVDARLDPAEMEVYACGLTAMVDSLVAAVEKMGVPPEHTQFEGFG